MSFLVQVYRGDSSGFLGLWLMVASHFVGGDESKVDLRMCTLFWVSSSLNIKLITLKSFLRGFFKISRQAFSWITFWMQHRNLKIWVMRDQKGPYCQKQNSVKPWGQVATQCVLSPFHRFYCSFPPHQEKACFLCTQFLVELYIEQEMLHFYSHRHFRCSQHGKHWILMEMCVRHVVPRNAFASG